MSAPDTAPPLSPNARLRWDTVSRLLPPGRPDVLEVGCGQGGAGYRLARAARSYVGVELDPTSAEVARQRIEPLGGRVVGGTIADLGADETFDLVCAFEVLEHIDDDAAALRAWAARLRPGGVLLLSTPAHQRRYGPADELVGHFRRYDPPVLRRLLVGTGLVDVQLVQYGVPLGYLLEAGRNAVGRRRLGAAPTSVAERTARSGRLLQPSRPLVAAAVTVGVAPFRLVQRAFPHAGPGVVARAVAPRSGPQAS